VSIFTATRILKGGDLMIKITNVLCNSLAKKAGVLSGDVLLTINGNEINDVLDYRFYLTETTVTLECLRGDATLSFTIKKGEYTDIGLDFETPLMDKKRRIRRYRS
jgi:NifB/MoaA-like Fe-S oxidoreductase